MNNIMNDGADNTTANGRSITIIQYNHNPINRRRLQQQSKTLSGRKIHWNSFITKCFCVVVVYCSCSINSQINEYNINNVGNRIPTTTALRIGVQAFQCYDVVPVTRIVRTKNFKLQQQTKKLYSNSNGILQQQQQQQVVSRQKPRSSTTQLYFMGSDNGILGVGGPEVALILLVGYFVLGPSDLYKLVKEIGKFIQNIRTLGNDLTTTFESNMESTLQLEEIRKAQRELNDAFSFRRTINVDANSDAFSVQAGSAQQNVAEAERLATVAVASTGAATTTDSASTSMPSTKKIRRRIRKKEEMIQQQLDDEPNFPSLSELEEQGNFLNNNVPDLDMPSYSSSTGLSEEEAAIIDEEFNKYVMNPLSFEDNNWDTDSISNGAVLSATNSSIITNRTVAASTADPVTQMAEQNRFQQQLSGNWNNQIIQAGDTLEPMALVMNKIALLEQEKAASIRRLEDEFAKRTEIEEKYYKEQRQLLEEAARDVQSVAFGLNNKKPI